MNKILYRIVTGMLVVMWMGLIFSFSSQPADESSKVSGGLCHRIVCSVNDTFHLQMTRERTKEIAEVIEYPVRKAAHMTEYAILGLLSFAFYSGFAALKKRNYLYALFTTAFYAATDEFHQYFIPGRSAELRDVLIDTSGAAIALLLLYLIMARGCRKKVV